MKRNWLVVNLAMLATAVLALICSPAGAQCTAQWLSGDGLPGTDDQVSATVNWDRDGTGPLPSMLAAAGSFDVAGGTIASRVAARNSTTGQWSALGTGMNDTVYALASLPNGNLVAGGGFTTAGGATPGQRREMATRPSLMRPAA